MSRNPTFVIVGGGLAGARAAEALRNNDFDGNIVLFSAEDALPYERPPLSKDFLAGKKAAEEFTVHGGAWYRDHDVEFHPGTEVDGIDRSAKAVTLPDGPGPHPVVIVLPGSAAEMALAVEAGHHVQIEPKPTLSDGTAGGFEPGTIIPVLGIPYMFTPQSSAVGAKTVKLPQFPTTAGNVAPGIVGTGFC